MKSGMERRSCALSRMNILAPPSLRPTDAWRDSKRTGSFARFHLQFYDRLPFLLHFRPPSSEQSRNSRTEVSPGFIFNICGVLVGRGVQRICGCAGLADGNLESNARSTRPTWHPTGLHV